MKIFQIFMVVGVVLGMQCTPPKTNEYTLKVSSDSIYQTIDGFGASDAWRFQFVGKNWPMEKREKIADWLFSSDVDEKGNPKGIGLSIWRFYLATGTTEQGEASGIPSIWRRGESFLSPDGNWDWTKYEGQRWFLKAAQKRGVPKYLAFTIAPLVQYAKNGKGFGTKGVSNFNILPGKEKEYAAYLANVLEYFKKNEGLEFDYLSPFNEPQWDWEKGTQEGTPAKNEELYEYVKLLSEEFVRLKLKTQIVPGEAAKIDYLYKTVGKDDRRDNQIETFFSPSSPNYIGNFKNVAPIISGHSYFTVWPVSEQIKSRKALAEKLKSVNPNLGYWQSEYCILENNDEIGQGNKRDLGMSTALFVARIIHNDLTICNAQSWQWWTAITESDYKDGLIYLDSGTEQKVGQMGDHITSMQFDGTARDSKLMWALGNYSRFVRPGMQRVQAELSNETGIDPNHEKIMVSAYSSPDKKNLVIVLVNIEPVGLKINASLKGNTMKGLMYLTSEDKNLGVSKILGPNIEIPARSVATLCYQSE